VKQPTLFPDKEPSHDDDGHPRIRPSELHRRDDPDTSRESAEHLVHSGNLGRLMADALERVRAAPGSTGAELDPEGFGSRILKRLNDLQRVGLVEARGEKVCDVTGRTARRWYATDRGIRNECFDTPDAGA